MVRDLLVAEHTDARVQVLVKSRGRDIKVLITINGVKIGIESQGDPIKNTRLPDSLAEFVEIGCEIIVCAARTYGRTRDVVDDVAKGYEIVDVRHEDVGRSTDEQNARNRKSAAKIVAEIEKSLHRKKAVSP